MNLSGKRVLVVGLGASGAAAARFCAAQGAAVTVTDSRGADQIGKTAREAEADGIELLLGAHPEGLFVDQDIVIPSPGVPWDLPALGAARAAGVQVAGELHWAKDELQGPTIGITGTNGKTTTTALVGHIFREARIDAQVGGNIGKPVLEMVGSSRAGQWNVLELSSFQLEAAPAFPTRIAAVLNVTPDHLDRHGSLENYAAMKERLVAAQTGESDAVLNANDPICRSMGERAPGGVVWFGAEHGAWEADGSIHFRGELVSSSDLPIRGPHNLENALAAVAITSLAGIPAAAIGNALMTFQAVPHRLEFLRTVADVAYYNDSKATNVDAALKAIASFDDGLWVILGGSDKGGDFSALAEPLRQHAKGVFLIGASAERIAADLDGAVALENVGTLERAMDLAVERARPGDTVLLAPACASFDQFRNYEHRGDEFRRMVEELED